MKNLIAVLFVLFMHVGNAQTEIKLDSVIAVEGLSQSQIYEGLKIWASTIIVNSNSSIRMDEKEDGVFVFKANMIFYPEGIVGYKTFYKSRVHFTCVIRVKDGRYKIEATDWAQTTIPYGSSPKSDFGKIYKERLEIREAFRSDDFHYRLHLIMLQGVKETFETLCKDSFNSIKTNQVKSSDW